MFLSVVKTPACLQSCLYRHTGLLQYSTSRLNNKAKKDEILKESEEPSEKSKLIMLERIRIARGEKVKSEKKTKVLLTKKKLEGYVAANRNRQISIDSDNQNKQPVTTHKKAVESTNVLTASKQQKSKPLYGDLIKPLLQFPFQGDVLSQDGNNSSHSAIHDVLSSASGGELADFYPSVTKIIKATKPPEMEFYLKRWQTKKIAELGEEGFKTYKEHLFSRGHHLHRCMEEFLHGSAVRDVYVPEGIQGVWQSMQHVLPHVAPSPDVEAYVKHPHLHYTGRVDAVTQYKDQLSVIDWKISEKRKSTLESTFDYPLQVAAYLGAYNADPTYHKQVSSGLIVVCYEDGHPADVLPMTANAVQYYWQQWLRKLHNYWTAVLNGTVQI